MVIAAVAVTGLIHSSYLTRSPLTNVTEKYALLLRNALCVVALAGWIVTCIRQELERRRVGAAVTAA
jgi:hypothetical protein